jgi:putative transposase
MYGHHYTPQTISNMTKIVSEDIIAFKERSLESRYSVIFMDATHIPLKRQTVSKEAVYIVIGIRLDGTKEVLGFSLAPTESAYVWKEILQDLKDRGLKEVLLVVTDGLSGINDSIHSVFIQMLNFNNVVSIYLEISLIRFVLVIDKKSVAISN